MSGYTELLGPWKSNHLNTHRWSACVANYIQIGPLHSVTPRSIMERVTDALHFLYSSLQPQILLLINVKYCFVFIHLCMKITVYHYRLSIAPVWFSHRNLMVMSSHYKLSATKTTRYAIPNGLLEIDFSQGYILSVCDYLEHLKLLRIQNLTGYLYWYNLCS